MTTNELVVEVRGSSIISYGYHNISAVAIDHLNYVEKRNAIIMPTLGAWFNKKETFESIVTFEMDYFASLAKRSDVRNKVLWLAAWPQHFNTTDGNGYYFSHIPSDYTCVPHRVNNGDWRNEILHRIVPNYSPFIELFSADVHIMNQMWDMHSFPESHDCTHWCYHPLFMVPLWHRLHRILDEFPSL